MAQFQSTCETCEERVAGSSLDEVYGHFQRHSDLGHEAQLAKTAAEQPARGETKSVGTS